MYPSTTVRFLDHQSQLPAELSEGSTTSEPYMIVSLRSPFLSNNTVRSSATMRAITRVPASITLILVEYRITHTIVHNFSRQELIGNIIARPENDSERSYAGTSVYVQIPDPY
jgi:hypothetical protein